MFGCGAKPQQGGEVALVWNLTKTLQKNGSAAKTQGCKIIMRVHKKLSDRPEYGPYWVGGERIRAHNH